MITSSNLKDLLVVLGFAATGNVYEKRFGSLGVSLSVNFDTKKLIFPAEIKGRDRNTGFDAPENLVVFECVNRLLEKGYRPEHIELEKEWHLGHDAKSGRADICVSNSDGSMLFIIECKTWGKEFDKALKDTQNDGAQLFSYWQQEQSTKWLVLYASDCVNGKVEYKSPTINCSDDANITLLAKKDKTIKLYGSAHTTPEKYAVWKETYLSQIHDDLIFSDDSIAYKIGVKPLLKKDLLDFSPEDKIVNRFEEILRHNNVSDKENAFNRLIALFICKLVDESTKTENDEVEFQYKQGTDTYETLQDRLQRLHRDGMEKFMREKIFYVSADYPEWLFSQYTGSQRKKAIEDLRNTIRILKFYSNNDFAFKDVHNEELFYQNGKILVEMVQLFEKYRIVYPSKHQFLGDLFEQLLNKGFKQNEGQFFTPMPITRFIWDSLPVDRMIKSERGTVYPKVIDYACGAGHFLTEAIEAINYFAKTNGNNAWVKDHIFGIEKDYRLARVAKISLFMNGAGDGNIIFGDGLENAPDKQIENGTFDILVANPPYSVKDFKQHLQLKNNEFELLDKIGLNGGEIETLFVERIAQLLKPKGIAAVILPSSILSNDSASYTGAREQLLKNFYIRGIVAFGSKTFGATGTNTVVLFLEKFNEPPKLMDMATDSVDAILSGKELDDWQDKEIFELYIAQIEQELNTYKAFLKKALSLSELNDIEYFKMYCLAFADSAEAKNLEKTKTYRSLSEDKQKELYLEKLYGFIRSIEAEKLYYFALVYKQKTVIIKAPADNNEQKKFLGYDWSNRKGNEGIQIITAGGKMYDDADREKQGTLAHAIRQSFGDNVPNFTADQTDFGSVVDTKDMLDYSRVGFNKALRITVTNSTVIKSKYNLELLGNFCNVSAGNSAPQGEELYENGTYPFFRVSDVAKQHLTSNLIECADRLNEKGIKGLTLYKKGTILFPKSGASTYLDHRAIMGVDGYVVSHLATIAVKNTSLSNKYLYLFLTTIQARNIKPDSGYPSLNAEDLENLKIPVPPIDIQNQIIAECEKIDEEYNTTRMSIEAYRKKIEDLFNELDVISGGGYKLSLANGEKFLISIGQRVLNKELVENGSIPVYSANVFEPFGYVNELLITDFSLDSVLWGIDGDWLVNFMPKDNQFYPTDHCGVLRCKTDEVNPRYLAHILESEGKKMGFSRTYRASIDRVQSISFYIPDIAKQNEVVEKVQEIEMKIADAEKHLESLQGKTLEILNKYLQ